MPPVKFVALVLGFPVVLIILSLTLNHISHGRKRKERKSD